MNFSPVSLADIEFFNTILSNKALSIDSEMMDYSHDYTEDFVFIPELVLKPEDTKEVSEIMRYCFEKNIPVTPSGARTGLSGGALPVHKGVVLSMEKFNKIINMKGLHSYIMI